MIQQPSRLAWLEEVDRASKEELASKHAAREQALAISRQVIRLSANAIRAVHRLEFDTASELLDQASGSLSETSPILCQQPEIYYAGFLADARKEYSEAHITLALISGRPVPLPDRLGVEAAAYLNGLGEAMGELRRFILDALRRDSEVDCEGLLNTMDEIYTFLVTVDYPEGVTGGLRRTTDAMRGVLERTRGDLTMALRQRELESRLASWQQGQHE